MKILTFDEILWKTYRNLEENFQYASVTCAHSFSAIVLPQENAWATQKFWSSPCMYFEIENLKCYQNLLYLVFFFFFFLNRFFFDSFLKISFTFNNFFKIFPKLF